MEAQSDWNLVHRQLARARESLADARDVEQFQAIGVLCREALISLAQAVYVPSKHRSLDGVSPSRTDAKRMLEAFIAAELPGETNRYARSAATSAVNLALDLQHSRNADSALAAMTVEQTGSVISLVSITAKKGESRSTIAELIRRYIEEKKPLGKSHQYVLLRIADDAIGALPAADLQLAQVLDFVRRLSETVKPQTVQQYVTFLRVLIAHARDEWRLSVTPNPINEAKRLLHAQGAIARSRPRTREVPIEEFEKIENYFRELESTPHRVSKASIPMAEIAEFSRWTGRRPSEICRLKWDDVDMEAHTCIVRDLIAPSTKETWDHKFPLLGRAWEIIKARDAAGRSSPLIFPYVAKTVTQRYRLVRQELGLTELRFQDLRRMTARMLLDAGHSLPEVIAVSGKVDTRPVLACTRTHPEAEGPFTTQKLRAH